MRGVIIGDVAGAIGRARGLDEDQAVRRIVNVDHPQSIFEILAAIRIGEDSLLAGRAQFENRVRGMALDAGLPVRPGFSQDRLHLADKEVDLLRCARPSGASASKLRDPQCLRQPAKAAISSLLFSLKHINRTGKIRRNSTAPHETRA